MYRALIVDDEQLAKEGLKLIVEWEKVGFYICGECSNGEDAINQIEKLKPDLIITDIKMPYMDGLELISYVKNVLKIEQTFVIMSGYSDFEYARKALKLGVNHYILKPYIEEEILEVLYEVKQQFDKKDNSNSQIESVNNAELNDIIQAFLWRENDVKSILSNKQKMYIKSIHEWFYVLIDIVSWKESDININEMTELFDLNIIETALESINFGIISKIECSSPNRYGFVVGISKVKDSSDSIENYINRVFRNLSLHMYFFIAVGEMTKELSYVRNSYNTAIETLKFSFFKNPNNVIYYDSIKNIRFSRVAIKSDYPDEIINAIEELDANNIKRIIDNAFYHYEEIFLEPEIIKMNVINIIFKGLKIVNNLEADFSELTEKYNISTIEKKIYTIHDLKRILKQCCLDCIECIKSLRLKNSNEIFFKIECYIKENYKNTITIKELGQKFYLHPVYLGQLFIKRTGETLYEYIHRLRIEEAKKLIKETNHKASRIALDLGYSNYNNFLHYFEKYASMKPSEYKSKCDKEDIKDGF